MHHLNTLNDKEKRSLQKNNKYSQKSIWKDSSTTSSDSEWPRKYKTKKGNKCSIENNNRSLDETTSISMSSLSISPGNTTSTKELFKNRRGQYKGKEKMNEDIQESNTMDKIIAMVIQIAFRLETIEINMRNLQTASKGISNDTANKACNRGLDN